MSSDRDPHPPSREPPEPAGVTALLLAWRDGQPEALDKLTPIVYDELRRLAHNFMRHERSNNLLQTTALVHEAYFRLTGDSVDWESRNHFYAIASTAMRRVLVDFARRRRAQKRGGNAERMSIEEVEEEIGARSPTGPDVELLALDQGLERLAAVDPRKARIVELRYFGGLTIEEAARLLDISHATVERELRAAKAWLGQALETP